ncbi:zincin [Rhizoclosmatium globosum]|uniref:Zincin n=1 Tax=Rhizoclosmatium globosum TaxID=329046 RepID=A0A1Y2CBY1_9FUNG|nr:zincin [Rhizoclosmatium globosum]|eukprot:ORY44436.1 zincin [Rhizoclosmatium globosum]
MAAVTSSTINGTTIRGVKCEAFFPNGLKEEVRETVEFLSQAMEFYEQFTGLSFPFPSYKLVFVHDAVNSVIIGAGVVIVSTHLLLDEDDIENVFDSRFRFAVMLASQWFGQYVTHRNWTDNWLTLGLANYMASLFIKKLLGNNEYRYRLSEDMKRVAAMDVGQLPLCPAFLLTEDTGGNTEDPLIAKYFSPSDEPDSLRTEFLSLKSPLVIGMLDQRLGKGNLLKVINKIMISTMSGELENGLSTNHFFKVCRKISASAELKSFADQWIFGSGCPIFRLAFKFNRKKLVVEVTMLQENTNRNHPTATKKFTGPFTVRVHEPKGIAYSHQIFIDEMEKVVELPYHTKYKRAGQKLKKLQKLGIVTGPETEQAEEEDEFQQEFSSAAPVGSEPAPKDKSKPDLDQLDRRSLEWIRWDPDGDWLCLKVYDQLRSMWIEQLARDLDVVAHHEAVVRLATMPDNLTTMALMRVLTDERHFYRLRMEAAFSLAKLGLDPNHGSPFPKLVKDFLEKYCYERAVNSVMTIPIPNDFTNFQEYFVKKAICTALVAYRDAEFKIPLQNKRIVLDLLRFNDNSKNKYSDAYYISALINAICHATIPQKFRENQAKPKDANNPTEGVFEEIEFMASAADDPDEEMDLGTEEDRALLSATISEVDRYLALDRLNASHHNIVTRTCIEAKLKWMLLD